MILHEEVLGAGLICIFFTLIWAFIAPDIWFKILRFGYWHDGWGDKLCAIAVHVYLWLGLVTLAQLATLMGGV